MQTERVFLIVEKDYRDFLIAWLSVDIDAVSISTPLQQSGVGEATHYAAVFTNHGGLGALFEEYFPDHLSETWHVHRDDAEDVRAYLFDASDWTFGEVCEWLILARLPKPTELGGAKAEGAD